MEKLQKMKADWVLDEFYICRLFPILQILDVVDKSRIFEISSLCQKIQVVGVTQALHKFQLNLKSQPLFFLLIWHVMRRLVLQLRRQQRWRNRRRRRFRRIKLRRRRQMWGSHRAWSRSRGRTVRRTESRIGRRWKTWTGWSNTGRTWHTSSLFLLLLWKMMPSRVIVCFLFIWAKHLGKSQKCGLKITRESGSDCGIWGRRQIIIC